VIDPPDPDPKLAHWQGHVRLLSATPMDVLKWTGVIFVVALEVLVIISIILAMVGVYE